MSNNNKRNLSVCFIIFVLLFSCNRKTTDIITSTGIADSYTEENNLNNTQITQDTSLEIQHISYDHHAKVEYDTQPIFALPRHDNMILNVNINEVDNTKINTIFEKPVLNKNIELQSGFRGTNFSNISEILTSFDIFIPAEDVEVINKLPSAGQITRLTTEYVSLSIVDSSFLFMIEYNNNNNLYDWNIKIGTNKNDIIEIFGEPSAYSNDGDVYIFSSFDTGRQINITFFNDKIIKVQLISFPGV